MSCNVERKHFEHDEMRKIFKNLYFPCGCCKDCVSMTGKHREGCTKV